MLYLHIGENQILPMHEIVAIINIEPGISPDTADVIEKAEAENRLCSVGTENDAKSLVICVHKIYRSPISSTTLYRRAMEKSWEEKYE